MRTRRSEELMERQNHEDVEDLPPEINQVKEQIENERFLHIKKSFELKYLPSVAAHVSHHRSLALNRSDAEDCNGRDNNNKLLSRMGRPLRLLSGSSDSDSIYDQSYVLEEDVTLLSVTLPVIEQLPRSTTWIFTNICPMMVEDDSVIGTRQIYYLDGEALELSSEADEEDEADVEEETIEEETKKEKCEFSEDVDRFIWKIGQDSGLDDQVVLSALTKFLEVDVSDILERYKELKIENDGNAGETSDLRPKGMITTFQETAYKRHCRRCLVFDCQVHEKYQPEIKSQEDISNMSYNEEDRRQCSENCYLKVEADDHVRDNGNSISNEKGENVVFDANTRTEDDAVNDTNEVTTDITEMTMWTSVEKDLYLRGVEVFGRNSCLVTLNLLRGRKTCQEVYNYMNEQEDQCSLSLEHNKTTERKKQANKKVSRKSTKRYLKRGRRKYGRCPTAFKNTSNGDAKLYKLYTPCTCDSTCGNQCICLTTENCCEKYCGCPKLCKNRFGGCNCAIGQCVNRHCPCFAANRECDPDICRNCCLGCGDKRSEQVQCKNMQFLLTNTKKILLARSNVHGWGAFTRHALKRNDYLGEYTGELITHEEANERGRLEERIGSSYLFTLNDQLEIDARRKGNKFKFLNHSAKPNCYAKLMIVRGDHRIGIFAGKAIEEGEELFFDYCYGPEHAFWSRGKKARNTGSTRKSKEARTRKSDKK